MKTILIAVVVGMIASSAAAQTTKPGDKFGWTPVDASLLQAQAYGWDLELDGVVLPTRLVATCVAGTPISCEAPIPPLTPASHTIRIRAVDLTVSTTPGLGAFSAPFQFTMRALPSAPIGLRIVPSPGSHD